MDDGVLDIAAVSESLAGSSLAYPVITTRGSYATSSTTCPKEALGSLLITPRLHQDVQHDAF